MPRTKGAKVPLSGMDGHLVSCPGEPRLLSLTQENMNSLHRGKLLPGHSRQHPAEDRAGDPRGSQQISLGRRGGGTRGTKSPAAQKCLPRETERKQTPSRFQQPYNANVFKPRRALLAPSSHLMRLSCLPCCCHCFYLRLLITHNQPL